MKVHFAIMDNNQNDPEPYYYTACGRDCCKRSSGNIKEVTCKMCLKSDIVSTKE